MSLTVSYSLRFRATLYQCPESAAERQEMLVAVGNRINDLQSVLQTTQDHSYTQLQQIAQEIDIWQQKVGSNWSDFAVGVGLRLVSLLVNNKWS